MPNLDPQYLYPDGAISASGHAGNLASSTPEHGLYTLYNGVLDSNNLGTFDFDEEALQLNEIAAFDRYTWDYPIVVYDDTVGGPDDGEGSPCGIGLRFYLPCDVDALRIDFSAFVSNARTVKLKRAEPGEGEEYGAFDIVQKALEMKIVPFFDGSALSERTFKLPQTFFLGTSAGLTSNFGNRNHVTTMEHRHSQQYRNSYVVTSLAKGIHRFELRVIMESPGALFTLENDERIGMQLGGIDKAEGFAAVGHQRLTFGYGCITMRAIGLNQP